MSEEDYATFVEAYGKSMEIQKLVNYKRRPGFLPDSSDPFHMELRNSRMNDGDPRVQEALGIYATETRQKGRKRNEKFERTNPAAILFLAAYDKAHLARR